MRGGRRDREHKPIPEEGPYRTFVGNLPFDMTHGDFEALFQNLHIKNIHMTRDRETDQFKGFAYVEFESKDDIVNALKVDGADFDGRVIRVDVADDKGRQQQRNRSPRGVRRGSDMGRGGFDSARGGDRVRVFTGTRGRGGDRGRGFDGGHRGDSWGRNQNDRGHSRGGERNQPNRGNREHGGYVERHNAPIKVDSQTSNETSTNDRSSVASGDDGGRYIPVVRNRKQRGSTSGMQEPTSAHSAPRHRGGARRGGESHTISLTSDPMRPKLNLQPRTTDPEELARRKIKEEEERKARLEKICTAK
uniref:RRM domain-containing protein n=1 Tax=Panagrolaimus sp. JU765 TaxID=591449 RepID=A0AC34PWJ8_9BILA